MNGTDCVKGRRNKGKGVAGEKEGGGKRSFVTSFGTWSALHKIYYSAHDILSDIDLIFDRSIATQIVS